MSGFELTLSHRGTTTEIQCKGELSDHAMERIKEAVEIGLRRGSTDVAIAAVEVSIRGASVPAVSSAAVDEMSTAPVEAAAYYLG